MRTLEKSRYILEVAEACRHKAQKADERIEKAIALGADDPKHEHHKLYLKLLDISQMNWKYHEEYLRKYAELKKGDELVDAADKVFGGTTPE